MHSLLKIFHLPGADLRLLIRAAVLLWITRIGLWLVPYQTVCKLLKRVKKPSRSKVEDVKSVESITLSVRRASRFVPAATCLTQALVTVVMLEDVCLDATLRIGVAKSSSGKLEAHAWVESSGRIVIGGSDADLSKFTLLRPVQEI